MLVVMGRRLRWSGPHADDGAAGEQHLQRGADLERAVELGGDFGGELERVTGGKCGDESVGCGVEPNDVDVELRANDQRTLAAG